MEGVTAIVQTHEKAEKAAAVRKDLENRINVSFYSGSSLTLEKQAIDINQKQIEQQRLKEKNNTSDQLKENQSFGLKLRNDFTEFTEKLYYKTSLDRPKELSEEETLI